MEIAIELILTLSILLLVGITVSVLDRLKDIERYIKYDHIDQYKIGLNDGLKLQEKDPKKTKETVTVTEKSY